jgi:hypothetical protein
MIDNLHFLKIAKNCKELQENTHPFAPPKEGICVSDCSESPTGLAA